MVARWVLDADIQACFDEIDHTALMDRVRARIKDKRVLALVKAFLKAGMFTELGDRQDTHTGTPQGGIISPLLANIALSVLDEHLHGPWKPGGTMSTDGRRAGRRAKGRPTWRLVRYCDDFVVMINGVEADVHALREEIATVLAAMGLRLSPAKTRVAHMSDGQPIFTASKDGDLRKVRNLQRLMLRCRSNALVAVRRVAQQNAGRNTAGVDGAVALWSEARSAAPCSTTRLLNPASTHVLVRVG